MDPEVVQAMQRWPNVPAAWGWLKLDRRGNWHTLQRDDPGFSEEAWAQAAEQSRSMVRNERLIQFMNRNYNVDDQGRWYFQNGPQRVYVDLELTPLVFRVEMVQTRLRLITHHGLVTDLVSAAWTTDNGDLILTTPLGSGLVDDRQMSRLTPLLIDGDILQLRIGEKHLPIRLIKSDDFSSKLGFEPRPRPPPSIAPS